MYLSDILAAVPETVEATAETTLSIGERVSKGLGTSLLGMATIFVMLTVLFIMMKLMSAVFGKNDKKAEKSVPAALPEKAPAPVTVQTEGTRSRYSCRDFRLHGKLSRFLPRSIFQACIF